MAQFVSQFVSSSNMFLSDSKMNPAERISGYLGGHFLITLSIQQSKLSMYEFFIHDQLDVSWSQMPIPIEAM